MNKGYIKMLKKEEKRILIQISMYKNVLGAIKIIDEYFNLVYTKKHQIKL